MNALLVVEPPGTESDVLASRYSGFLEIARQSTDKAAPATMLSENCWLIPLQNNLPLFSTLMRQANQAGLSYRVAFIEKELAWCHSKDS